MKQKIVIIAVCLFCCVGCTPPKTPVWENVKFKDLARAKHSPQNTLGSPLQFTMYIFTLPADNFADIKDVWIPLSTKPIWFSSPDSFGENGFAVGVGKTTMWNLIAEKLREAESKTIKKTDLIMFSGDQEDIALLKLEAEKNIFYRTQDDQINGATLGPGEMMLRLIAVAVPDVRGACKLTVEPMFKITATPQTALADAKDLVFTASTFSAKMSPGDFVLLGPKSVVRQDMTLGGIFFSSPQTSTVQIYMIVCAGVSN